MCVDCQRLVPMLMCLFAGDGWGSHSAGGGFGKAPPRKPADLRAHAHPYSGGGRGAARY